MDAIAAIARCLRSEPDPDRMVAEVCRLAAGALKVSFCQVLTYRADTGDLLPQAGTGWAGAIGREAVRADATSPAGEAFLGRRPVVVPELRQRPHYDLPAAYLALGVRSAASLPISDGEERFGVLELASACHRDFSAAEMELLGCVADMLGAVLPRMRRNQILAAQCASTAALAGERETMWREMQHRVRNDLQLVGSLAERHMRRAGPGRTDGFEAIASRVLSFAALYDHLLGAGMARRVDLGDYLRRLCSRIEAAQDLSSRGIALAVETQPAEMGIDAAASLGVVVNELVTNAIRHAFAAAGGRITVRLVPGDGTSGAMLSVSDDGRGFDAAAEGRGLHLARQLVERLGGVLGRSDAAGTTWCIAMGESA
ncbi:MAG TPA: GAF domain-containing protein [Acetobacteraceae bacterium]